MSNNNFISIGFVAIALYVSFDACAQNTTDIALPASASTEQMIERLKGVPRLRNLRNVVVEEDNPSNTIDKKFGSGTLTSTSVNENAPVTTSISAQSNSNINNSSEQSANYDLPSLSLQIQFNTNSARIWPESLVILGNLAEALKSTDLLDARFAVEGHTDAKGGADYNLKLSYVRAEAVCMYLIEKGIDRKRLQCEGKGKSDLANKINPYAAENRRVRIVKINY